MRRIPAHSCESRSGRSEALYSPDSAGLAPSLATALRGLLRSPFRALIEEFNWKTALISAILRAILFFFNNLRSGHQLALKATLVEAVFAISAMGVFGAVTERILNARPVWLTGLMVWLAIPATMLSTQYCVHRFFGTPPIAHQHDRVVLLRRAGHWIQLVRNAPGSLAGGRADCR
jgi:hypothetical protein